MNIIWNWAKLRIYFYWIRLWKIRIYYIGYVILFSIVFPVYAICFWLWDDLIIGHSSKDKGFRTKHLLCSCRYICKSKICTNLRKPWNIYFAWCATHFLHHCTALGNKFTDAQYMNNDWQKNLYQWFSASKIL